MAARDSDPTGLHRVLDEPAVLPQAAQRLDTRRELWPDEVRIRVEKLNLDAASFRQLERKHAGDGDAGARRGARDRRHPRQDAEPRDRLRRHARRHRRGGGGASPRSGWRSATGSTTLVSLTLTPLVIEDGLERWDGRSEQVPCDGYAVLFGRSIAAVIPDDLAPDLSPERDGRVRRPGADRARRGRVRRADRAP